MPKPPTKRTSSATIISTSDGRQRSFTDIASCFQCERRRLVRSAFRGSGRRSAQVREAARHDREIPVRTISRLASRRGTRHDLPGKRSDRSSLAVPPSRDRSRRQRRGLPCQVLPLLSPPLGRADHALDQCGCDCRAADERPANLQRSFRPLLGSIVLLRSAAGSASHRSTGKRRPSHRGDARVGS